MATLRKGCSCRELKRPYTRKSKYKRHNFIPTLPPSKIVKFNIGDSHRLFKYSVKLVSREGLNLRHNSLESVRQVINRTLQKKLGNNEYYFVLNAYPHHIIRENKMIQGAGADRMQTGMSHAFGKPTGRAARIMEGSTVITIKVDEPGIKIVKEGFRKAIPRLPGKYSIKIEKIE